MLIIIVLKKDLLKRQFPQITSRVHLGSWLTRSALHVLCRWRLMFSWRIWSWLSPYWNKCFFAMIMVLIVLFLGKRANLLCVTDIKSFQQVHWHPLLMSLSPPQMLCVRCRSILVPSPCRMLTWTRICTTTSTWSFSEPRGTSTYLASLSFFGC